MKSIQQSSKLLSFVLRHRPESIGIKLDKSGWTSIDDLLKALNGSGNPLTRQELDLIVESDEKGRYSIQGHQIRANQGHSVAVDLKLKPVAPPPFLYHGTVPAFLASILKEGLKPMKRHHVHLSDSKETALKVGSRRGQPVLLEIDCRSMHNHVFYKSDNGVWLTDHVPPEYIHEPH